MSVQGGQKTVRPKNAATLLLIDWQKNEPFVLMGKRSANHIFLPNYYVFPGGRVDRCDYQSFSSLQMHKADESRLLSELKTKTANNAAQALALAAIRETAEETGLFIGKHGSHSICKKYSAPWNKFCYHEQYPNLHPLRYFARAITPPGHVRRFDTRFFMVSKQEVINPKSLSASNELDDLQWVNLSSPQNLKIHGLTKMMMKIASVLIKKPQDLQATHPVHFFYERYGKQHHELIL